VLVGLVGVCVLGFVFVGVCVCGCVWFGFGVIYYAVIGDLMGVCWCVFGVVAGWVGDEDYEAASGVGKGWALTTFLREAPFFVNDMCL